MLDTLEDTRAGSAIKKLMKTELISGTWPQILTRSALEVPGQGLDL